MPKITLKNKDYCDKCTELIELGTLAGHKKCKIYGTVLLSRDDLLIISMGQGTIQRPQYCKDENETEIKR